MMPALIARAQRAVAAVMCMIMSALLPEVANAHPIHTTYAVITREGTTVTLRLRAFADDLSAAVAHYNRRATPADSSAPEADSYRYLTAMLSVTARSGAPVPITPCGVTRAAHLTYVCLRLPAAGDVRMENRVLADVHADQVNIMQVAGGATVLFTRNSGAKSIRY